MTVYVDSLTPCAPNRNWRWGSSCHLFADSVEELHGFARQLGMRKAWFQDHRLLPHYDLTAGRRAYALRLGATDVGRREVAERMRRARADG